MAFQFALPAIRASRSGPAARCPSSFGGTGLRCVSVRRWAYAGEEHRAAPPRKDTTAPRMDVGEGDGAPSFGAQPTSGGGTLSAADLGDTYIIYFYPKDSTSGCTCEAQDFTARLAELAGSGVRVVGVSRDDVESHDKFVAEVGIGFPLLADVSGEVSDAYGVYKLRQMFGKEFMGIERSTFIVKGGKIAKAWRGVKATGHADEVVAAVKQL
jgi:thioredoxin-dependent peroxiredoxin